MTHDNTLKELTRDCNASLIPSGDAITIKKGEMVRITQSLGTSYTVLVKGNLARIEGYDSDAIGIENNQDDVNADFEINDDNIETMVWDALKNCFDPEIPVNIVDLGLIYDCSIKKDNDSYDVSIKMTLTAPGCGMGPVIADEVDRKVNGLDGVEDVSVELVWEPMWTRDMMSEAAQLELGMF